MRLAESLLDCDDDDDDGDGDGDGDDWLLQDLMPNGKLYLRP